MNSAEERMQKTNKMQEIIGESKKLLVVERLRMFSLFLCCAYLAFCSLGVFDINALFLLFFLILCLSMSAIAVLVIKKNDFTLPDSIIQLLNKKIDEEGRAYLSDLKAEWMNSGETQYLIKIKELIFILDYLWGRFIGWMRFQKIYKELQDSPEDKLEEVYDMIHYFRLDLGKEKLQPRTPGLLTGKLGDAFFEPLSDEELQQWE
jgi:hypothetical protein